MYSNDMFKQMIQFNRAAFMNAFDAAVLLQDQAEKTCNLFWERNASLPKEGKKALEEWLKVYKTGRETFKTSTMDFFSKVESMVDKSEAA